MINLFSKTDDFIKSEKKKHFRWFAVSTCPPGQVLDSVNFPSDFRQLSVRQFGQISHVSVPKMVF